MAGEGLRSAKHAAASWHGRRMPAERLREGRPAASLPKQCMRL